ncbi:phage holin family protein [Hymenobacter daeguensis]
MFTDDDTSKTPRNDSLIGNLTGYLDTRIDLVRLELQQRVSTILVGTIHGAALAMLGLLFIIFVSIFAGLALNSALNSPYWGFGVVAGFYLVLLVLVVVGVDKAAFQGIANKVLKDTIYKSDKRQA